MGNVKVEINGKPGEYTGFSTIEQKHCFSMYDGSVQKMGSKALQYHGGITANDKQLIFKDSHLTHREQGDANFHTVLKGDRNWVMAIQFNGEIMGAEQTEIMNRITNMLNNANS